MPSNRHLDGFENMQVEPHRDGVLGEQGSRIKFRPRYADKNVQYCQLSMSRIVIRSVGSGVVAWSGPHAQIKRPTGGGDEIMNDRDVGIVQQRIKVRDVIIKVDCAQIRDNGEEPISRGLSGCVNSKSNRIRGRMIEGKYQTGLLLPSRTSVPHN
jgi:hypothetical protein